MACPTRAGTLSWTHNVMLSGTGDFLPGMQDPDRTEPRVVSKSAAQGQLPESGLWTMTSYLGHPGRQLMGAAPLCSLAK